MRLGLATQLLGMDMFEYVHGSTERVVMLEGPFEIRYFYVINDELLAAIIPEEVARRAAKKLSDDIDRRIIEAYTNVFHGS